MKHLSDSNAKYQTIKISQHSTDHAVYKIVFEIALLEIKKKQNDRKIII